jgi:hypothetical protein
MGLLSSLAQRGYVPFAFGASSNLDRLDTRPLGVPLRRLDAADPANASFHRLLNKMNGLAYGGMGMPLWVQFDCGVLPSAFIGWGRGARDLPERLRHGLGLVGDEPLVPIAEALSVPSATPGQWVSWSMCSVLPGSQLGFASKLVSLAAYKAESTLGVAQYDNGSLRIHTRFGPLELVQPMASGHTWPERTFVYRLDLRDPTWLKSLADGATLPADAPTMLLDPDDVGKLRQIDARVRAGTHRYWLLPPGRVLEGDRWLNPILEQRVG